MISRILIPGADSELSRDIYAAVESIVLRIGARREDLVAFAKYAASATQLTRPSSAAHAIAAGAPMAERIDKLAQLIRRQHAITHPAIDHTVALLDAKLAGNQVRAA